MKETSFVTSVRPHGTIWLPLDVFYRISYSEYIENLPRKCGGAVGRSWSNWKVVGSVPDGVTGIFFAIILSVALCPWGRLNL
jgi:hypothetical protein